MSVLKKYFDKSVNQESPVKSDFKRVVNVDENGVEYITWETVDYPSLQSSLGTVDLWTLDALLKAGINPDFPIHTSIGTRLEGAATVQSAVDTINAMLDAEQAPVENNE